MHLILKLVNGEVLEQTVESTVCIIGRSAKCTVVVPHDGMSRQHCQIDVIEGEYFITDLGSTNGVYIDGQRIEAHQKTPYQTFLTLSFGAVQALQIENEEAGGDSLRVKSPHRREVAREDSTGVTSLTKTKTMAGPKTAQAQANWKPKTLGQEKTTKSQTMMINVIVVLIIAAAVFWYTQKEDSSVDAVEEIPAEPIEKQKSYDQF
jgi:pSer/pThr/pTyr-binding forkhead associated (FHA) protein